MVNITILGSCRFSPYNILAKPDPLNPAYTVSRHHDFNTDEEYENAKKIFFPAIEDSDVVLVFAPDGIGEHTQRDLDHTIKKKIPYIIFPDDRANSVLYQGLGLDLSVLRFEFDLASLTRKNAALDLLVKDHERLTFGLDREIRRLRSTLREANTEVLFWKRGRKMEKSMHNIKTILDGVKWL